MARLSKEKFALRGSIVILCLWALLFFSGYIAETGDGEVAFLLGMFWIVFFYWLAVGTLVLAPLFAVLAIMSLSSNDPNHKRTATIALLLAVLSIAPPALYWGMFL